MPLDPALVTALRADVEGQLDNAQRELATLVAFKSVADPRQFPASECVAAAEWVRDALLELGFDDAALNLTSDGSHAVVGHSPRVEGAPTVLLYSHYDVQPPLVDDAWHTPPFTLTEKDGRWWGRGAADCKGNIVAHLMALRAIRREDGSYPVNVTFLSEGSEEQGGGGLEDYVPEHVDELRANALLICDAGNISLGQPTFTTSLRGIANAVITVKALEGELHSGMFGGAAPDALAALIHILASFRDEAGNTTIEGLANDGVWAGAPYDVEQFRADATPVVGASILGSGTVADMLWARPALTVLGIDAPPVIGSSASIVPNARAVVNLRIPPGIDPADAEKLLASQVNRVAPWGVEVSVESDGTGAPFAATTDGPAYNALGAAMEAAFGKPITTAGQGGSIPLTNVLAGLMPDAEIVIMGVEEPACRIHAPNESVAPSEIVGIALAEALFLTTYGA